MQNPVFKRIEETLVVIIIILLIWLFFIEKPSQCSQSIIEQGIVLNQNLSEVDTIFQKNMKN